MKTPFAQFHRAAMHQELHGDGCTESTVARRDALKLGVAATAAAVAAGVGTGAAAAGASGSGAAAAGAAAARAAGRPRDGHLGPFGPASGAYGDEMFDVDAVLDGAWDAPYYGEGDERGTLNELNPERTAAALALLDTSRPIQTYQLGEEMFNGFPAFPSDPPRLHDMFLYVLGYEAPDGFVDGGGIQSATMEPIGPNLVTGHEERFAENFTFQIATQIDGLNHIGVGPVFYGGHRGPEIAKPLGTTALGNETMGPITARGVIYDVVGLKVEQGDTDAIFEAPNGEPVLVDNYRITLDDMRGCLQRQKVAEIRTGDVAIMRTGWTHLVRDDAERYLTQEPGIYLEEGRYFADKRVALVCSDTWGLEVLDPDVTGGNAFPVHQELLVQNGIRIGESFVTDSVVADECYEGVFIATPENVPGATCGSTPPCFLGQLGAKSGSALNFTG